MVNVITKKAAKKIIKGTIAKHSTKALLSSQAAQTVTKAGLSTAAKVTLSATVGIGVTAGVTTAAVKVYQNHEERTHNTQTISSNEEIPSTLIKDEVINPIIWAVDPDEHAYDSVESMTFLSGRDMDGLENESALLGYPSQWSNSSYSANVLLGKCADGYTLFNYDGKELLDEHFGYIGHIPWIRDATGVTYYERVFYCTNEEPWGEYDDMSNEQLRNGGVPIAVNQLGYYYSLEKQETYMQLASNVGASDFEMSLIDGQLYHDYEIYKRNADLLGDRAQPYEPVVTDLAQRTTGRQIREYLYKVCSPEDYVTVFGASLVDKEGNICPTFNYQPAGLIVNGIVAVKNEPFDRYLLLDTYDRDFSKGEVANGGGLAVLNAYTGKLVTDFEYDALGVTTEGYTPVKKGDKWGLVRVSDGEVVIDCILDNVSNVYAGKVYVEYEGKKGVLALNTTLGLGIEINADTLS